MFRLYIYSTYVHILYKYIYIHILYIYIQYIHSMYNIERYQRKKEKEKKNWNIGSQNKLAILIKPFQKSGASHGIYFCNISCFQVVYFMGLRLQYK